MRSAVNPIQLEVASDVERRSFSNMVYFYRDELQRIHDGTLSRVVLNKSQIANLKSLSIIVPVATTRENGLRTHRLTDEALQEMARVG